MKYILQQVLTYSMIIFCVLLLQSSAEIEKANAYSSNEPVTVSIFYNNDGESSLTSKDGYGNAASFVALLRQLRSKAEKNGHATLTLSSGDNFLAGTAFSASMQDNLFYDAVVLNEVGYDAIALGNHDFDFGPDVLADFIYETKKDIPFLSANLDFSQENNLLELYEMGRIAPSVIVESDNAYFGIVGLTTPELASISSPRRVEIMSDILTITQTEINKLIDQQVNKIILVSHLQSIEEEKKLVAQLYDVDIVIAGGGNELLANEGDILLPKDKKKVPYDSYPIIVKDSLDKEVPIVTTTGEYQYIGNLVVSFDAKGNIVSTPTGSLIRVADPMSEQSDAIEPDLTVLKKAVNPILLFEKNLANTVLAKTEVVLDGTRQKVRSQETNLGSLIADSLLWQAQQLYQEYGVAKPDIAFQNGGGIRNSVVIKKGENISKLDTFTALPFPNFLVVVPNVSASKLKLLMENAVSQVENTKGRFAQISGFSMQVDVSKVPLILDKDTNTVVQEGKRIITLQLDDGRYIVRNGKVIKSAPSVSIATINFLAQGGDQYPFNGHEYTSLGTTYQQSMANYLSASTKDGGLSSIVTAELYPAKGSGRIIFKEK